jgi:hypothetical protein
VVERVIFLQKPWLMNSAPLIILFLAAVTGRFNSWRGASQNCACKPNWLNVKVENLMGRHAERSFKSG